MKLEKLIINLGDTHEMFTHRNLDFIITKINNENTVLFKKDIPEFMVALLGAYIDSASNEEVNNLIKGIKRKLNIRKSTT